MITDEDLKGVGDTTDWTPFQLLLEVARIELEKLLREEEEEEEQQKKSEEETLTSKPDNGNRSGSDKPDNLTGAFETDLKKKDSDEDQCSPTRDSRRRGFEGNRSTREIESAGKAKIHTEKVFHRGSCSNGLPNDEGRLEPFPPHTYDEEESSEDEQDLKEHVLSDCLGKGVKGIKIREPTEMPRPTPNPKLRKRKSMKGKEKAKRRPKKPKVDLSIIQFPSELPEPIKSRVKGMNGTHVTEVGRKSLTFTDLSTNHNRLTIPTGSAPDFLTPEEKDVLETHSKIKRPQKRPDNTVLVIDPLGNAYDLNFRKWTMGSDSYAWTTCWNDLVAANGLKEEDVIQVWTFRSGSGKRCFVVVVVTRKDGDPSASEIQNCEASTSGVKNCAASPSNESEEIINDEEKDTDDETMAAAEEPSKTTTQPMGTDK